MRHKNLTIAAPNREEADRFQEEYTSLGFHVTREGTKVVVWTLQPKKVKKKDDESRERRPARD